MSIGELHYFSNASISIEQKVKKHLLKRRNFDINQKEEMAQYLVNHGTYR